MGRARRLPDKAKLALFVTVALPLFNPQSKAPGP